MANIQHTSLDSRSEIVSALTSFLTAVRRNADQYAYVVLMEGSFLDLFCATFPCGSEDVLEPALRERLFSNRGLLLRHQDLAEYYSRCGSFPPILLLDGIVDYGRNIAKFLFQMEEAVVRDICREDEQLSYEEKCKFQYRLSQAIDIRIFARSRNPLLLGDRYVMNTVCNYKLYGVQIRRVANLLSRSYFSKTAAPNFALSLYPDDQISIPFAKSESWEYVPWDGRQGGNLHTYIRPYTGASGTYLIQTVRFYEDQPSLLTSHSLLPNLDMSPGGNFSWICDDLCGTLADPQYEPLRRILADKTPYAQQGRGQLISFLLSIGGLIDFCESYGLPAAETLRTADLTKLALSFSPDSAPAFSALLSNPAFCRKVSDWIRAGLRRGKAQVAFQGKQGEVFPTYSSRIGKKDYLLFLFGAEDILSYEESYDVLNDLCTQARSSVGKQRQNVFDHIRVMTAKRNVVQGETLPKIALSTDFSDIPENRLNVCRVTAFVNNKLERELYAIGMRSEANAHCFFDAPFLYRPTLFEEYDPHAIPGNPSGILSISEFLALAPNLPVSGYGQIAAYLSLLDQGIISSSFQYVESYRTMYSVCTIGDQALSYLPQKLAPFIPALSTVEKNAPLLNLSSQDAVLRFVRDYLHYDWERRDIGAGLFGLKLYIQEYLDVFNDTGHRFAGWNFEALTKQSDPAYIKAQKCFLARAKEFIET